MNNLYLYADRRTDQSHLHTHMRTPSETVKAILDKHRNDHLAFIVGNGINRHKSPHQADYAWDVLVRSLWANLSRHPIPADDGLSLTEAYDIISLSSEGDAELARRVEEFVYSIEPTDYQGQLCQRMMERDIPILTTNFDHLLESSHTLPKRFLSFPGKNTGFTSYYPWNVYFRKDTLVNPAKGFGIWHINGMVDYPRSMRLGLTQYMNQVSRMRNFIHSSDPRFIENDDFGGKNQDLWKGCNTWLHIIFNCPLMIFGLSLDVNETFLRWLLIEREKYFARFPHRRKAAWYLCYEPEMNLGKQFFLQYVGFDTILFDSREEVFESVLQ